MSGSLSGEQFGSLLHGSINHISIGDTVRPGGGMFGFGAYATNDAQQASIYAGMPGDRHAGQGSLFGTVYNVEPVAPGDTKQLSKSMFLGKSGLRVTGVHSHVIPFDQEQLAKKHGVK